MITRIISIFFLTFFISSNTHAKIGKGDLTFTPEILEYFLKYVRNEYATSFVVSKDGKFALYGVCSDKRRGCSGGPGHTRTMMKNCKTVYGDKCFIFAQSKKKPIEPGSSYIIITKKIRWNKSDYEFPYGKTWAGPLGWPDGEGEGIKKNITNDQIFTTLKKLGFLKDNSPKKRLERNINPTESITAKIKKLFDLFKSGALSEDEFKIAKKMLLYSEN